MFKYIGMLFIVMENIIKIIVINNLSYFDYVYFVGFFLR